MNFSVDQLSMFLDLMKILTFWEFAKKFLNFLTFLIENLILKIYLIYSSYFHFQPQILFCEIINSLRFHCSK